MALTFHVSALRGTGVSCALLTVLTVLIALYADNPQVDPVLRVLYFAVLFGFFHSIGRLRPGVRGLPYLLIETGFLVLTLSAATATTMRGLQLGEPAERELLVDTLERGAVFLVGLSLISYGIILWLPQLLESQRILRERYTRTKGELQHSERARSRIEKRIIEAEELHTLGELAAGVAHDLRNPLAIVLATADSLRREERSREQVVEHSEVICRNIRRAERTISALLDLGKPKRNEPRNLDVGAAIAEVTALVSVEARRRQVTLERRDGDGARVVADQRLLGQILLNLLLNALQESPSGSTVRIGARRHARGGEAVVAIAVEDRGRGIAGEDRAKLFNPFFTTKPEGTGLGLLSCRRLIDEMGGSIGLYPRTRGGARALVLLPAIELPAKVAS